MRGLRRLPGGVPRRGRPYDLELSTRWQPYLAANADFFADMGSQGGAADLCRTGNDPDS
ncbi:hypothetical protein [Streptomyces sp. HUAS ZL42]|uniref:hypothetical protein n=1 Tax=Streptomyces sp. HUAS ZL42 TaxID=3231715 RepID=UPI00345E58B1